MSSLIERTDIGNWMRHKIRCVSSDRAVAYVTPYSQAFPKSVIVQIADEFEFSDLTLINDLWMRLGYYGYAFTEIRERRKYNASNAEKREKLDRLQKSVRHLIDQLSSDHGDPHRENLSDLLQGRILFFESFRSEAGNLETPENNSPSISEAISFEESLPRIEYIVDQLKYLNDLISHTQQFVPIGRKGRKSDPAFAFFMENVMAFWRHELGREITTDPNEKGLYTHAERFAEACVQPLDEINPAKIKTHLREMRTDRK